MNEKEKMLNELLYDANYNKDLIEERKKCKVLCAKYNNSSYDDTDSRIAILKKILGKTKENFIIEPSFWCDYGYNIELGENFYSNHNLVILDPANFAGNAAAFNCFFLFYVYAVNRAFLCPFTIWFMKLICFRIKCNSFRK